MPGDMLLKQKWKNTEDSITLCGEYTGDDNEKHYYADQTDNYLQKELSTPFQPYFLHRMESERSSALHQR